MDKPLWGVSISRHHNPLPERPSNLRILRNLGAKPRQQKERLERGVLLYPYFLSFVSAPSAGLG